MHIMANPGVYIDICPIPSPLILPLISIDLLTEKGQSENYRLTVSERHSLILNSVERSIRSCEYIGMAPS